MNQAAGTSVPVMFSIGWWQPECFGAGVPSSSSIWNDANGTGRSSWVMSTTQRNAGGPANCGITSSSATSRILRPPISNGTGIALWVGVGNGGDQSRPETNFGFDMSSMSMMTKPPSQ